MTMPGPGWQPTGKIQPNKKGSQTEADYLNALAEAAARANHLDFSKPGFHTQSGFYATEQSSSSGSTMKIVLLQDALLPGTYDLPGTANGLRMTVSNGKLVVTSESIPVVNFSTSIYGPIGGLVYTLSYEGLNVAIGSAA